MYASCQRISVPMWNWESRSTKGSSQPLVARVVVVRTSSAVVDIENLSRAQNTWAGINIDLFGV